MRSTFSAEPKIELNVGFSEGPEKDSFLDFLRGFNHSFRSVTFDGIVIVLKIDDAEKVVEWLKKHGVEPRR